MGAVPVIDYRNHPGLAASRPDHDPAPFDRAADEVNAQLEEAFRRLSPAEFRDLAGERLTALLRPLAARYDEPEFDRFCQDVVSRTAEAALVEAETRRARSAIDPGGATAAAVARNLGDLGYSPGRIPQDLKRDILAAARPYMDRLEAARADSPASRHQTPFTDPDSLAAVKRALDHGGIIAGAGAYKGLPLEMYYCALEYSTPDQEWWRWRRHPGLAEQPRTSWMHYDKDLNICKCILYLNDVDADSGAFSYVPGSHAWTWPLLGLLASRMMDRQGAGRAWDSRFVHLFDDEFGRRAFMRLPRALQFVTVFGDDLLDGSAQSDSLLAQEKTFAAKDADLVVFDGGYGIHRGARARVDCRWALQIGLAMPGLRRLGQN